MVDEAEIKANVEEVRRRQEARDDAEKAKEFDEMRKRNEARLAQEQAYRDKLRTEKSSAERIRLRQQDAERIRLENIRISAANKGIKPQPENYLKPINTETVKGAVREGVSKAPYVLDKVVTGIFTPVVQTAERPPRQSFAKGVVQESRQFSKVVASAPKKPVTGGKVKPVPNQFAVSASPVDKFTSNLLGGIGQQKMQQPARAKKQEQQVPAQQRAVDPSAPLNRLFKKIF